MTQVSIMCLAVCVCDIMTKASMCDTDVYYVSSSLCLRSMNKASMCDIGVNYVSGGLCL